MALHIIVDGYNAIRQSPDLRQMDREDLQSGREALVDRLAAYKCLKGHKITVVFDGNETAALLDNRDREKGILIRFSRGHETADAVIKRMAARDKQKALVVSSDREVADFCAAQGAAVIGAADFDEKMALAALMDMKGAFPGPEEDTEWAGTTRKKGPSKRLPKKVRLNRKKLKKL